MPDGAPSNATPLGSDDQIQRDFMAARSQSGQGDAIARLNAMLAPAAPEKPAAAAPDADGASTPPAKPGITIPPLISPDSPINTLADSSMPFGLRIEKAAGQVWQNVKNSFSGPSIAQQISAVWDEEKAWRADFAAQNGREPNLQETMAAPYQAKLQELGTNIAMGFAGGKIGRETAGVRGAAGPASAFEDATTGARRAPNEAAEGAAPSPAGGEAGTEPAAMTPPPEATTPGAAPYATVPKAPPRLWSYLKSQGGLQDPGGDVAELLGGAKRPGLINKNGLPLDDAALKAWEQGYFPELGEERPTPNQLLDALREDVNQNPRFSEQHADQAAKYQGALDHNAEIDRLAQDTGVDTKDKTAAQFYDAVADQKSQDLAAGAEADRAASDHDTDLAAAERLYSGGKTDADMPAESTGTPRTLEEMENAYRQEEAAAGPLAGDRDLIGPGGTGRGAGGGQAGEGQGGGGPGAGLRDQAQGGTGQAAQGVKPPPFTFEGQPAAPLEVTPEMRQRSTNWVLGRRSNNPIQASIQAMANTPMAEKMIADVARFIEPNRVKPDDLTRQAAYTLAMSPDDIMHGLRGTLPNDEQVAAWSMLMNSTARELQRYAIAGRDGDLLANEDFNRAFTLQTKIVGDWTQAGTDLGRAQRARKMPWGEDSELTKSIQTIIENVGADNWERARNEIAALPTPDQVNNFLGGLRRMSSRDGLLYWWYNALLSNPGTIVKKLASDVGVATWNVLTRQAAGLVPGNTIPLGEAGALLHGYVGSFGDALRAAGTALKAGESQFAKEYQTMDGATVTRLSMLVNGAEPLGEAQPTRSAMSYLQSAMPTSWIGAADDLAKVWNYRAEARALLYREGARDGLAGDALSDHITAGMENMPQHIHEDAMQAALRNTFQEPLEGLAQKIQEAADLGDIPIGKSWSFPLGRVILPFVKVPANILKFAYRNSPMPLAMPSAAYRAELAAGGATRDLALARVGMGTGASLAVLSAALGYGPVQITGRGPTSPDLRRAWMAAGNQPYSLRIGDNWYQYNRIEPMAQIMGAIADTVDIMRFAKQEDAENVAAGIGFGMGNAMLSKTYMSGLSDFLTALHEPDQEGARYADRLVASLTTPQLAAGAARAIDPTLRAHYDMLDAISARLPYVSQGLPPQRNLWGDPIQLRDAFPSWTGGAGRMISPIAEAPVGADNPIDKWIWDNRNAFPMGPEGSLGLRRAGTVISISGGPELSARIELSPQAHDRFAELAGNAAPIDRRFGLGAKDTLNALVDGNHPNAGLQEEWDKSTPAAQAMMVQSIVNQGRQVAKAMLLREYPEILQAAQAQWQSRASALKGGAAGGAPGAGSASQTSSSLPAGGGAIRGRGQPVSIGD